jgi:hypothetical protein
VDLVHTQKIEAQSEKPTWTKALEFTEFACPCGTDPHLLSGEQRTSHFKLVTSVIVKVCGCRPHDGGAARTGAGVRKPPMEETAGRDTSGGAA